MLVGWRDGVGAEKYKEFDATYGEGQRAKVVEEYEKIQEKINIIKIKGIFYFPNFLDGMFAPYNENDAIFELSEEINK